MWNYVQIHEFIDKAHGDDAYESGKTQTASRGTAEKTRK
jgi:hypothetical protein